MSSPELAITPWAPFAITDSINVVFGCSLLVETNGPVVVFKLALSADSGLKLTQ